MLKKKSAAAVAALSVAVLGLGACTAQPGTAVSVNGVKYSEAEVTEAVADYKELTGQTLDRSTVVRMIPDALKFTELADAMGLQASDEDVAAYLEQLVAAGKVTEPSDGIGEVMSEILRYTVISSDINSLGQDEIATASEEFAKISDAQQVEINPRYGTLAADGSIQLPKFGDVVDASDLLSEQSGQ